MMVIIGVLIGVVIVMILEWRDESKRK